MKELSISSEISSPCYDETSEKSLSKFSNSSFGSQFVNIPLIRFFEIYKCEDNKMEKMFTLDEPHLPSTQQPNLYNNKNILDCN